MDLIKNKLISFSYSLKLFLTLNYTIKSFYQTYSIYLMTKIKLLSHFKLSNWFTKYLPTFLVILFYYL